MRYRIENVSIPETRGIANLGQTGDEPLELRGRRIIHVFDEGKPTGAGAVTLRVLTEQEPTKRAGYVGSI